MSRVDALNEFLSQVDAGNEPSWADVECCFIHKDSTQYPVQVDHILHAYRGSLDAAKALHEAVLPEWDWIVGIGGATAVNPNEDEDSHDGINDCPARSWLIAILKALISQETPQ